MILLENLDNVYSYICKNFYLDIHVAILIGIGFLSYKVFMNQEKTNQSNNTEEKSNRKLVNKLEKTNFQELFYLINSNEDKEVDAFFILNKMQKNRFEPDIVIYNSLFDMSFRLGQFHQANKLYEEISDFTSPIQPDISCFNMILKGCVIEMKANWENKNFYSKFFDKINYFVNEIKRRNLNLNDITYNILINAFAEVGKNEKCCELFDEMRANKLKPDLYTYNTLLKGLKSLSYSEENFKKALEIFEQISSGSDGLIANEFLYNTILDICVRYNEIEIMDKISCEMKQKNIPPSKVTYSILIKGYGNAQKLEKVQDLFNDFKKTFTTSDIIYGCLINCCAQCKRLDLMNEYYEAMKIDGITPNLFIYTTLIKGYCKMKQFELAFNVFEKMKEDDMVKPNIVIYNSIINNCIESKNYDKMIEIYTHLKKNDSFIQPDFITYTTLIKGFCRSENMPKAEEIYKFMIENDFKLDIIVLNLLCKGYCYSKNVDKSLQILEDMKKFNVKPLAITYTYIIKMFSDLGDERALLMLKEMTILGIKPTIVIYTSIIIILNKYKKTNQVIDLYYQIKGDKTFIMHHLFYENVVLGCLFDKKLEIAINILIDSIESGVKLDNSVYNKVIKKLNSNKFMKPNEKIKKFNSICIALKKKNYSIDFK